MNSKKYSINSNLSRILKFYNSILLILVALIFYISCETTTEMEKTSTPVDSVKTKTTTVLDKANESSDLDVLELPKSKSKLWSIENYSQYNESNYEKYPAFNKRIDLKNIDYPLLNAAVFYETNAKRVQMKLPPLAYSPALEKISMEHSNDMVKANFYSHNSPIKGRETPVKRMESIGVKNAYSAENINIGYGIIYKDNEPVYPPSENKSGYFSYTLNGPPIPNQTYSSLATIVVNSWMNSPGHRRNILNENLKYMGVGAAHYKDSKSHNMDKFKITQTFASIPGVVSK
jgi:uncharacterized protein YkwD